VARTDRLEARHIVEGVLGCPSCGAEYAVRDGVVRFGTDRRMPDDELVPIPDAAVRAAALLGLTTPGGLAVLAGAWAEAAVDVAALADGVHVLALNAATHAPPGLGVSFVDAAAVVPLGDAVARGIALDEAHAAPEAVRAAAAALLAKGRLIAPASAAVPPPMMELARDERWWVAERPAAVPVVPLTSSRRSGPR
jgi:hypothetical protein